MHWTLHEDSKKRTGIKRFTTAQIALILFAYLTHGAANIKAFHTEEFIDRFKAEQSIIIIYLFHFIQYAIQTLPVWAVYHLLNLRKENV